jgi:hypothetical protein
MNRAGDKKSVDKKSVDEPAFDEPSVDEKSVDEPPSYQKFAQSGHPDCHVLNQLLATFFIS